MSTLADLRAALDLMEEDRRREDEAMAERLRAVEEAGLLALLRSPHLSDEEQVLAAAVVQAILAGVVMHPRDGADADRRLGELLAKHRAGEG
jgi:hypothetical protein